MARERTAIAMSKVLDLIEQGKVITARHFKETDDEDATTLRTGRQTIYEFSDVKGDWIPVHVTIWND